MASFCLFIHVNVYFSQQLECYTAPKRLDYSHKFHSMRKPRASQLGQGREGQRY